MRTDLNMRKGKMIAQGAHASMSFLVSEIRNECNLTGEEIIWLSEKFTKVCLQVGSEEELLNIHEKAKAAGLKSYLITDSGQTEFHGVLTNTCIAIGPHNPERIDKITGDLKLL